MRDRFSGPTRSPGKSTADSTRNTKQLEKFKACRRMEKKGEELPEDKDDQSSDSGHGPEPVFRRLSPKYNNDDEEEIDEDGKEDSKMEEA
ncbi:MAG: hypothetical protein Q9184_005476 [Pyrenodesmia sp. 2 TL-2023]